MAPLKKKFQSPPGIVGVARDCLGRQIVLHEWAIGHIRKQRFEVADMHLCILSAIENAQIRGRGKYENREEFYAAGLGPSAWMAVVVEFDGNEGKVITAIPVREPKNVERI